MKKPTDHIELGGPNVAPLDPDTADLGKHPNDATCACGHARSKHKEGPCEKARFCKCQGFEPARMALVTTNPEHRKDYELIRQMGALSITEWPDARILAVRQMYAAEARNNAQLAMFMSIAGRHGLDPALNEIQLIQTDKGPKCYAGRDGFLRSASMHPEMYSGIQSGVVYPQDDFVVEVVGNDVRVLHTWSPLKRQGRPHGAYAIAYDAHGRPTYVYRETKKCEQLKSFYWQDNTVDDAIHNRAIGAVLRRVVPLGGLLIHGEAPLGEVGDRERAVETGTKRRLMDIRQKLGLDVEVVVDANGKPEQEDILALLDSYGERFRVPPHAVLAWARSTNTVPDNPEEWTVEHQTIAAQAMLESEGMDMMRELARSLSDHEPDLILRADVLTAILSARERTALDSIIEELWARTPQGRP